MSKTLQVEKPGETTESAYVMIKLDADCESNILDELRLIHGVRDVYITISRRDILAVIKTSTLEELRDTIVEKIGKIPQISSTTTFIPPE